SARQETLEFRVADSVMALDEAVLVAGLVRAPAVTGQAAPARGRPHPRPPPQPRPRGGRGRGGPPPAPAWRPPWWTCPPAGPALPPSWSRRSWPRSGRPWRGAAAPGGPPGPAR